MKKQMSAPLLAVLAVLLGTSTAWTQLNVDANVNLGGSGGTSVDANANVGGGNGATVDANLNLGGGSGGGTSANANVDLGGGGGGSNANVDVNLGGSGSGSSGGSSGGNGLDALVNLNLGGPVGSSGTGTAATGTVELNLGALGGSTGPTTALVDLGVGAGDLDLGALIDVSIGGGGSGGNGGGGSGGNGPGGNGGSGGNGGPGNGGVIIAANGGSGGGMTAGLCVGPTGVEIAGLITQTFSAGNTWSATNNVDVIPLEPCPAVRADLTAAMAANSGAYARLEAAVAASPAITTELRQSGNSASDVVAVIGTSNQIAVYVY